MSGTEQIKLAALRRPLEVDEIDFRVQSINKGGYATILVYKDARCDMNRLDEVVGPLNWRRKHTRDNHNCVVSIYNPVTREWVDKEDTGTESSAEAEKGLASDSFKRACFNWGIGRELYDYPLISVKLHDHEWQMRGDRPVASWKLRLKDWRWESEFDDDGSICRLACWDETGAMRWSWEGQGPGEAYTREQRDAFQRLALQGDDPLAFLDLVLSLSEEARTALHNSGRKGEKVKLKEAAKAMERAGHAALDTYESSILELTEREDIAAAQMMAEVKETGRHVSRILWDRLPLNVQQWLVEHREAE